MKATQYSSAINTFHTASSEGEELGLAHKVGTGLVLHRYVCQCDISVHMTGPLHFKNGKDVVGSNKTVVENGFIVF